MQTKDMNNSMAEEDVKNPEAMPYGKIIDCIRKRQTKTKGDMYDVLITVDASTKDRFLNAKSSNITFNCYDFDSAVKARNLLVKSIRAVRPKRRHPIDGWTKEECAKEYAKTYIDNINNALKTDFEFSAENYSEVLAEAVKTYARKVFTGEFSCEQIGKDRDLIISILGYYKGKRSPLEKTYDALKNGFSLSAGYINNIMPEFFKMYAQEAMDENDNEKLLYAASILKSNEK
ncbi:hypothetical protein bpr_II226 (plasmid) [Butyrivibrio proteoclasticus B316]|uniref:Uncharacterized protein n=1 Tax=Butyrivibrio proteoclasticus (strain ATCC 51982 / DSM 14932 / B316) TaxID=515622 RepID=E0S431_BUTPB|nr:hypothetical protein [Butyrivibrio proteoclasticus]ADL36163.1 hypothetical protein bpr_II226 [Butyrivibrio proteoclasticus B316]